MKNLFLLIAAVVLSFNSFAQDNYQANTSDSKVIWKGYKPTGSHHGTVNLTKGYFTLNNGTISGGEFTIDMNSIVVLDIEASSKYNAKLVNHLKSADFFEVEVFPTATFKVTGSEKKDGKTLIKGMLTVKDKTKAESFLADVSISGNTVTVKSDVFKINRADYNVKYKSKSFFNDLKEKFIEDEMDISIDVKASK